MELDASRFPLIVMRWNGAVSDDELEQLIQECDVLAARAVGQQLHYVVVAVGDGEMTPTQRKRMATWMNGQESLREQWDLGSHVVVKGVVARGALTALMWITPSLARVYLHADEPTAMAAAKASLEQANTKRTG